MRYAAVAVLSSVSKEILKLLFANAFTEADVLELGFVDSNPTDLARAVKLSGKTTCSFFMNVRFAMKSRMTCCASNSDRKLL